MSLPKKMTVKCSKCGAEIEVTVFESINTDFAADIIEQITSGDLFNAKCGKCGFVSHLEYDVLYHDVKHGAMIWVLHDTAPEYSDRVSELRNSANILGYKTTRIVNNMNELRQKVACLENGRDDRIIELCKVFIAYNLLSKQPDFDFNNAFYTTFLGKERVFLYDKNGQELSCELTDDTYSLLCEMYYNSEYASSFEGYYALVDYDWAEGVLHPLLKREAERIDAKNVAKAAVTNNSAPVEKKVVCPKCKQELPKDSQFCHFCGANLKNAMTSTSVSQAADVTSKMQVTAQNNGVSERFHQARESDVRTNKPQVTTYQQASKGDKTYKVLLWVLVVLVAACLGVALYQNFSMRNQLDTLLVENNELKNTVSEQKTTISKNLTKISNLQKKADNFDDICESLQYANIGTAAYNFKADESIIVVRKNETDRKFTLTAHWGSGGTVSVAYSSNAASLDFDKDSWSSTVKMTVNPRSVGATVVTFSNDVNSDKFKILIIVTE